MLRLCLLALLVSGLPLSPAAAQDEPSKPAVVLAISDVSRGPQLEAVGVAAYRRLLQAGPYATVEVVQGRDRATARIAAAITSLTQTHRQVDVVISSHTTRREPAELERLIPAQARARLRLVVSVACFGAEKEREAWEAVGATTVVTYRGLNNPLWALPSFLSDWIRGAAVGRAIDRATRETALAHRFVFSLPGSEQLDRRLIAGSVPVVSGDATLTIARGWLHPLLVRAGALRTWLALQIPSALRYERQTGSSLGLLLRCLSGRLRLERRDVAPLLELLQLPPPFTRLDPDAFLRAYVRNAQLRLRPTIPPTLPLLLPLQPLLPARTITTRRAELVLEQSRVQRIPLVRGLSLRFGRRVTVRAGVLDPLQRTLDLQVTGVDLVGYGLTYTIRSIGLRPNRAAPGYRVRVRGALGRILPLGGSYPIGGTTPPPLTAKAPRAKRQVRGAPQRGIADHLNAR